MREEGKVLLIEVWGGKERERKKEENIYYIDEFHASIKGKIDSVEENDINEKTNLMISQTLFLLKRYGNSTIFTRDIYSANNA